jgi:crotonobetainyl-CoA:carnitine CoA-transferase CaiB-like acyl-CoA transferase
MTDRLVLADLRVVEIASGVAGPMATCRLGDLGADVVKVETSEGDWTRGAPPFMQDGASAAYFALNRGKRSLRIGDDTARDRAVVRALVERADVLVTDRDSASLAALGLEGVDADVCTWNQKLVVAQISDVGRNGPQARKLVSEIGVQAMAGYTRYVGTLGEPSIRLGADVAGCSTAIFATQAVLAALFARRASGVGQRVDLSLLNSLLAMKTVHLAAQSDPDAYEGPRVGGAYDPPERGWKTADAPITFAFGGAVGAQGRPGWTQFVEAIGLARMLDDARFDKTGRLTTGLGPKARELKSEYEQEFVRHSAKEIVAKVREFGGFASAYLTHDELLREPQFDALAIVHKVDTTGDDVGALAFPVKMSATRPVVRGNAPALGQHTHEIARELGLADAAR